MGISKKVLEEFFRISDKLTNSLVSIDRSRCSLRTVLVENAVLILSSV